ncbi:MAG: hypothetical protein IJU91_10295 [Selenomonadaceae bacterium]|nr:hypothetical protein [Selenomonadaceae bacterium]
MATVSEQDGNDTVFDANDNDKRPYAAGYILLRYLIKQMSSKTSKTASTHATTETVQSETEYAHTSNSGDETISYYQFWKNFFEIFDDNIHYTMIYAGSDDDVIHNRCDNVKITKGTGRESIYGGEESDIIIHYAEEMPPILYDDDTTDDKFYAKYLGKRLETLEHRQCNADYQRREHVHLQQQRRLKICSCRYRSHR